MQAGMNLPGLGSQRSALGNIGMSALGSGLGGGLGNALGLQNSPGRNSGLNMHPGVGLASAAYPPSGDLIAMMNKANVTANNSQLLTATQSAFNNTVGQQQQQQQQQQLQQQGQGQGQGQGPGQASSMGGQGQEHDQPVFDQSEFPALGGAQEPSGSRTRTWPMGIPQASTALGMGQTCTTMLPSRARLQGTLGQTSPFRMRVSSQHWGRWGPGVGMTTPKITLGNWARR